MWILLPSLVMAMQLTKFIVSLLINFQKVISFSFPSSTEFYKLFPQQNSIVMLQSVASQAVCSQNIQKSASLISPILQLQHIPNVLTELNRLFSIIFYSTRSLICRSGPLEISSFNKYSAMEVQILNQMLSERQTYFPTAKF